MNEIKEFIGITSGGEDTTSIVESIEKIDERIPRGISHNLLQFDSFEKEFVIIALTVSVVFILNYIVFSFKNKVFL